MTAPASMRPRNLSHIAIGVTDMDRSLAFYRDVIGLAVSADQLETFTREGFETHRRGVYLRWADGDDEAFVVLDQTLSAGGDAGTPKQPFQIGVHHFGFWVADIDAVIERARHAGAEVAFTPATIDSHEYGEPAGRPVRVAMLRDPDGNCVQLDQRVTAE